MAAAAAAVIFITVLPLCRFCDSVNFVFIFIALLSSLSTLSALYTMVKRGEYTHTPHTHSRHTPSLLPSPSSGFFREEGEGVGVATATWPHGRQLENSRIRFDASL